MVKIIANYLPQFHRIPENDNWWGEGYTDWVGVKDAKPVVDGISQPKIPLNNNYYSLDNPSSIRWQAKLAKEYGIYGFGIYHYWFNSDMCLLDKPVKLLQENKDIDIPFMLIWDNASWKRSWSAVRFSNDWAPLYEGKGKSEGGVLAKLVYGDREDWLKHFNYLLPLFEDERYIKHDNKPVFGVFNQDNNPVLLREMIECWNEEAKNYGFDGIEIWGKYKTGVKSIADMNFYYEPHEHGWMPQGVLSKILNKLDKTAPKIYDYDQIWKNIIKAAQEGKDETLIYGGFVGYDDTPRRGKNSRIVKGASPEKFKKYLEKLVDILDGKNKEYMFLTAWNEWGEGAYLEPDEENAYSYLESVKNVIEKQRI